MLLMGLSCSSDQAEQEYIAASRGEEEGMSGQEQLARLERAIVLQPLRAWYREAPSSTEEALSLDPGSGVFARAWKTRNN